MKRDDSPGANQRVVQLSFREQGGPMNHTRSIDVGKRQEAAAPIIVATADQIRDLIRDELRAALADLRPTAAAADECLTLDYPQAEVLTGVSASTLARAVKASELRPIRIGRAVRFDRSELQRWLSEGAV